MCTVSFKERVRNEVIANAKFYKVNFVDYEYLICSEAFENGYHIIKSDKGNYLHLIGIHTQLSAEQFFDKCVSEELEETDFDFRKPGKSEKSVKGSVREKITVLPEMVNLFTQQLLAEDVDLIFRRPRSSEGLFDELVWGKRENIPKYEGVIEQFGQYVN